MEIPPTQAGSNGTPTSVGGTTAPAPVTVVRAEAAASTLTVSAWVQSSQPAATAATPIPASTASSTPPTATVLTASPVSSASKAPALPITGATPRISPTPTTPAAPPVTTASASTPATPITPHLSASTLLPAPATLPYVLDLLVNTQRQTTAAATVTTLNDTTLKLLAQGQVVRLQAQSPVPVPPGSVMQLQWSPATGMRILRINPPEGIPQAVRTFVGAALSGQGSPAPLLQTLQQLMGSTIVHPQEEIPDTLRALGSQLLALLPDQTSITKPGVLQQFVARSGLFFEAEMASLARVESGHPLSSSAPHLPSLRAEHTQSTSVPVTSEPTTVTSTLAKVLGHLREQMRGSIAVPDAKTASAPVNDEGVPPIANDFKAILLQLQQYLQTLREKPGGLPQPLPSPASEDYAKPGVALPNLSPAAPTEIPKASASATSTGAVIPQTNANTEATPQTPLKGSKHAQTPAPLPDTRALQSTVGNEPPGKTVAGSAVATPSPPIQMDASRNTEGATAVTPSATKMAATITPASDETGNAPPADDGIASGPLLHHSRSSRAADQYQRLEQVTRPPPRPLATGVTQVSPQQEAFEAAIPWAEMTSEIDIPGLGLPLPHRQRLRSDEGRDSLDNLLGLLLKRSQEALNRLHLHQLSHAGTTTRDTGTSSQSPPITFDLPVFFDGQIHVFNTRIDEEELPSGQQNSNGQKAKQWSVSLGFDIDGLGPMFCQLQMTAKQANLQFWADRPATLALTREHLGFLSKSLQDLGVTISEVKCHEGLPKQTRTRLSQQLVDINT